jgi:diadenylate cyclase
VAEWLSGLFSGLGENAAFLLSQLRLRDVVDMALVWLVVYRVLLLIRHTGTVQMLSGLGILAIAYLSSIWLELFTFNWLLEKFFNNLFLIVVILFQGEIRRALAQIGANPFITGGSTVQDTHVIEEIAKSALLMAQKKVGALIVIERDINLEYFLETGTEVDATVSSELINSIFLPTSPLHDGAVVVRRGRLWAAGCFLPLSKNPVLDKNLGTRHRAAIGLTEETDALVIVVSEENNVVGVVESGQLIPDVDHQALRRHLYDAFGLKFRGPSGGAA